MSYYVLTPRELVKQLLDDVDDPTVREQLEEILANLTGPVVAVPPWEKVRNMAAGLRRLIDERGPVGVHELDQLRATMRDELDAVEVSLHDEWAVYHGLVWVAMVVELARNGYKNGAVGADVVTAIEQITTTIASGLLEFIPPGALE